MTTTTTEKTIQVTRQDVDIIRTEGDQIILPKDMTLDEGITWLVRKKENEEKEVAINEEINAYPLEGAYALMRALQHKYGFTTLTDTPGFFGSKNPPVILAVEVDLDKTQQVPWGRIQIPGISGFVNPQVVIKDGRPSFALTGTTQKKFLPAIHELGDLVRKFIREQSIYRGKALRVSFPEVNDPSDVNLNDCPRFMDLSGVNGDDLIFPTETRTAFAVNVLTPIRHMEACRKAGIPRKRGILMEGPYGVGKTLAANVTAKACMENGWTFLYVKDVSELPQAILFARLYQPAVIFAEDIDRVTEDEDDEDDRSDELDKILNTMDGVDTKSLDVMVILTTNHVDRINHALLRPGRLDAVISVRAPDVQAVEKLIRRYARGLIPTHEDLTVPAQRLDGQIPAVIREVVERSKLAAIESSGTAEHLSSRDLIVAADMMLAHLELMKADPENDLEHPAEGFIDLIAERVKGIQAVA